MKIKKRWGLVLATIGLFIAIGAPTKASAAVPDISEWQGRLTSTQVSSLKSQANFVINRVQYGSGYEDIYHASNESLYVKYGVPFGSYDFSTFTNVATAKAEAQRFYARANKNTRFYVLDFETTSMNSRTSNAAVKAWYSEMRSLTKKKLIFYSYQSFAGTYANSSRQSFDAQWIANYSSRPTISYSLWQYSSSYYLKALNQYVDNSLFDSASVTNYHPLSWWLSTSSASTTTTNKPVVKPVAKPVTYAYSSYKVGQAAYVLNSATNYYGGVVIPKSSRQKMYKITAVKALTKSRSKQIVYVSGLNKWLYAQDINGYWANGSYGAFKVTANTNIYSNAALTSKTGKQVAKGATVKGTVVNQSGNTYQVKLDNGGYITGLVTASTYTAMAKPKPKPVVYAYSSYKVGQTAYVLNGATHYYGGVAIPKSVRQKMYKITAVKALTKSRSKQIVYVSGLNKWLYAQDINGYWANGSYGAFKVAANTNIYSNAALTSKSGKWLAKGATVKGTVVNQSGNTYQVKLDNGGYITGLVTASAYTAMAKPKPKHKPVVYAYSSYRAGQAAYVSSGATNYYGGQPIARSVRQKMYKITAVKALTKSRSKQIVYVAGLNKWLYAQDIGGYWPLGASGRFTMKYSKANIFNDVNLKHKSGRTLKKGTTFSGKVVRSGRLYRIKLSSGGYITASVQETNH